MKNLFLDAGCIIDNRVYIGGRNYHYLKNVRRVKKGNRLDAVIGQNKYELVVTDIVQKKLVCDIIRRRKVNIKRHARICVYQGLLKSGKMDFIVSKLSELGVEELFPLKTCRTVPIINACEKRRDRWCRIAQESSKVSGSEMIMEIKPAVEFAEIKSSLKIDESQNVILFSTSGSSFHIKSLLDSIDFSGDMKFHLFFGPEGGFSADEINVISELNGISVSMGNFVLKSETAAIVGTGFIRLYYSGK